jgi:hypothetical protein
MQLAWLIWSLLLLIIWIAVYASLKLPDSKREMLRVSLVTSLLGFTEPFFVPAYWNPPSLFNLAQRTGFDIESFLFSFGVGGLAAIVYERFFPVVHRKIPVSHRHQNRHRLHLLAAFSAPIIFLILFSLTKLNPVYSTVLALFGGGLFTWYCRPDLIKKMIISGGIFLFVYFGYFFSLNMVFPEYVKKVWNLSAISGILIAGIPLEELFFAAGLGFLWSGIYEHFTWKRIH